MSNKPPSDINDEERALFRQAMEKLRVPQRPVPRPVEYDDSPPATLYYPEDIPNTLGPEDQMQYARSGLQDRLLKRLRRGTIRPQASLDLHRHTISMAEQAAENFIQHAQSAGLRCVLIVHGKGRLALSGYGKMKNWLNVWLPGHPAVLAYHSALPKHGGSGAVYILLKQCRQL